MTSPSIIVITKTLAPGQTEKVDLGGAEIAIRKLEGALEIEIGLDQGRFLTIAQGEYFTAEHDRYRIHNPNAVTVVVSVLQTSEPGVYGDRRDQATDVEIGGNFAVVNSAYADKGGIILPLGDSSFEWTLDAVGSDLTQEIVAPSGAGTTGIYIWFFQVAIRTKSSNTSFSGEIYMSNPVESIYRQHEVGWYTFDKPLFIPSSRGIRMKAFIGGKVSLWMKYKVV